MIAHAKPSGQESANSSDQRRAEDVPPRWTLAMRALTHGGVVVVGACLMTTLLFLVLPLIQAITKPPEADLMLRSADLAALPAPPPPTMEEPEPEPEPDEPPPQLEPAPPLSLSQLEMSMNAGMGGGWGGGASLGDKLDAMNSMAQTSGSALVSMAELDQAPRISNPVQPEVTDAMRRKLPGKVFVLFVVDEQGRVLDPFVQKSTDPIFERAALAAVKKWRFEPGKRKGEPVRFRMRAPVTFPKAN